MRKESEAMTIEYTVFEVGEKVKPSSGRCPLPPGVYTVTEFFPPHIPYEQSGIAFVKGHKFGVDAAYLMPTEESL